MRTHIQLFMTMSTRLPNRSMLQPKESMVASSVSESAAFAVNAK